MKSASLANGPVLFSSSILAWAREKRISLALNYMTINRKISEHERLCFLPEIGFDDSIHSFEKRSGSIITAPVMIRSVSIGEKVAHVARHRCGRAFLYQLSEEIAQCSILSLGIMSIFCSKLLIDSTSLTSTFQSVC